MKRLSRWYLAKPVIFSPGEAERWLSSRSAVTLVTSPHPLEIISPWLQSSTIETITDPSIEVSELSALIERVRTPWIAAVGGGRVIDAAKFLALRTKAKLCVIPSVLSTTTWLNMAIALRKDGVLYFPGTRHANTIIVDPTFISKAPPSLTLGGLADILASASAVGDWLLANEMEKEKVSGKGVAAFKDLIDRVINNPDRFSPDSPEFVKNVYDVFLEGLELCGASFSGRPVEGSEHFLFYYIEELAKKTLVHGSIIALTTLECLKLQGANAIISPDRLQAFFDSLGIKYLPDDVGIDASLVETAIAGAREFVTERHHPYTILNQIGDNGEKKD
jgi:glycerol dehydrogenase-like iron-containing ADH family enzyme